MKAVVIGPLPRYRDIVASVLSDILDYVAPQHYRHLR